MKHLLIVMKCFFKFVIVLHVLDEGLSYLDEEYYEIQVYFSKTVSA